MFNLFNKPGKRYWYHVKYTYKDVSGHELFNITSDVGLPKQSDVLNHRKVKKSLQPLHMIKGVNKAFLDNGNLYMDVLSYLGHFKK